MTRRILISGTRKGLGLALAKFFLEQEDRIIGISRGPSALEHRKYSHREMDITREADVDRLFSWIREQCGGLDCLVNNAAIGLHNFASLSTATAAARLMSVNVIGAFLLARGALRLLSHSDCGRIVSITSVASLWAPATESIYAASKSAVETFTRGFAKEAAPLGVTVNCVGVSLFESDLSRALPVATRDAILRSLAISRAATAADVANAVEFFLRRDSAYVTGQTLFLGGPR
jgi:3-oxoacyl-[acyl-carrier protein] reductase